MSPVETLLCDASQSSRLRSLTELPLDQATELVAQHLSVLPERQKLALGLRYYEFLDLPQIAAVLGVSPAAAETLLQKAMAALDQRVERALSTESRATHGKGRRS